MRVLITGAAGNLGSFLTRHLLPSKHDLHLLIHQKELPFSTKEHAHVHVYEGDLEDPLSLYPACKDVDCLVHFAGVLFALKNSYPPRMCNMSKTCLPSPWNPRLRSLF